MSKRILVLGASGMLGGSLFRYFSRTEDFEVLGTVRSNKAVEHLNRQGFTNLIEGLDVKETGSLENLLHQFKPAYIFNCIGLIKQLGESKNPVSAVEINSLLPHKLAALASSVQAKLIHFSTDCVFSGNKGCYAESDVPDAFDIYGRSKLLGEVDYDGHLTLRTSIIGHELDSSDSLIDWFLSQKGSRINGYSKAVFSGLPTCYMAEFIDKYVISNDVAGLYHLSVEPIDKFTLLNLVKDIYKIDIDISEFSDFEIDRSLDSSRLRQHVNFSPLPWPQLVKKMYSEYCEYFA